MIKVYTYIVQLFNLVKEQERQIEELRQLIGETSHNKEEILEIERTIEELMSPIETIEEEDTLTGG